jgi:hypothetical protein
MDENIFVEAENCCTRFTERNTRSVTEPWMIKPIRFYFGKYGLRSALRLRPSRKRASA